MYMCVVLLRELLHTRKEQSMYIYYKDNNIDLKVIVWKRDTDSVIAQTKFNGKSTRKSKCKLRKYNDRDYFICKGHRYYLDKFTYFDI